MTNRDFFTAIASMTTIDSELADFAKAAIEKMDKDNARNRERSAEKRAAKRTSLDPVREALLAVMGQPMTATEILEAAGRTDIKVGSVPSLLKPYIESGVVVKTEKDKHRAYALAEVAEAE